MFNYNNIFFIVVFLFSKLPSSISVSSRKNKNPKCEYGLEYIKGKSIKPLFDFLPKVLIDREGVYKYIQIKCNKNYIFIRGRKDCKYHKNIYKKFLAELKANHLKAKFCKVLGGGRIEKKSKRKKIKIYGYSNRYGRAKNQHKITKQILEHFYPKYDITWSNDGY